MQFLIKNFFAKKNTLTSYTLLACLFLAAGTLIPASAWADNNIISQAMCNAINQITGGVGRSIAIIVIISLAISMFLGKVTWGVAIATLVGTGVLFGAPTVVNILGGSVSGAGC